MIISSLVFAPVSASPDEVALWADCLTDASVVQSNFVSVVHVLLMRIYLCESVVLNVLLLVGLILAIGVVAFLQTLDLLSGSNVAAALRSRRVWRRSHTSIMR